MTGRESTEPLDRARRWAAEHPTLAGESHLWSALAEVDRLTEAYDSERARVRRVEALIDRANRSAGLDFSVSTTALRTALADDTEGR